MKEKLLKIECETNDFYEDNILVKSISSVCKEEKPNFEIFSLPFKKLDFSKKEIQLFSFIYKNEQFTIIKDVKRLPISFPLEIIFVKICCKDHFINKKLTIKDKKTLKIIKLSL